MCGFETISSCLMISIYIYIHSFDIKHPLPPRATPTTPPPATTTTASPLRSLATSPRPLRPAPRTQGLFWRHLRQAKSWITCSASMVSRVLKLSVSVTKGETGEMTEGQKQRCFLNISYSTSSKFVGLVIIVSLDSIIPRSRPQK